VPEIVGGSVLEGGTGAVATTELEAEAVEDEPAVLAAVTTALSVPPTSMLVTE
jgi:hypothetical protein